MNNIVSNIDHVEILFFEKNFSIVTSLKNKNKGYYKISYLSDFFVNRSKNIIKIIHDTCTISLVFENNEETFIYFTKITESIISKEVSIKKQTSEVRRLEISSD